MVYNKAALKQVDTKNPYTITHGDKNESIG